MKIKWLHSKNKRKPKMVKACPNCGETMYYLTPNTMTHIILSNGLIQNSIIEVDETDDELDGRCFDCDTIFNAITGELK